MENDFKVFTVIISLKSFECSMGSKDGRFLADSSFDWNMLFIRVNTGNNELKL